LELIWLRYQIQTLSASHYFHEAFIEKAVPQCWKGLCRHIPVTATGFETRGRQGKTADSALAPHLSQPRRSAAYPPILRQKDYKS
jgi:hypothetical protein